MNTNLWHLMFTIERDKKDAESKSDFDIINSLSSRILPLMSKIIFVRHCVKC